MLRFLAIALCIAGACFYWRGSLDTSILLGFNDLGIALEQARTSIPWPGKAAEDALEVELTRSAALEKDVKRLSAMVAQADAAKAARDEDMQTLQIASQADAEELRKQRQRADALLAQLAARGNDTDSKTATFQDQLKSEKARAAQLERDVAAAREQLARAAADKSAAVDLTRQSLQDTAQGSERQRQNEHERAESLATQLAALQQNAASYIGTLQKQLDDELARSATLERDRDVVTNQLAQAAADKAAVGLAEPSIFGANQGREQHSAEEHERAEKLAMQLTALQRDSASQISALQKEVDEERARSAKFGRELDVANGQLAQAAIERTASDQARQSLQDAVSVGDRQNQEEHKRAETLAAQLAKLQQSVALRMSALQKQLDDERARPATGLRTQQGQAVRDDAGNADTPAKAEATVGETVTEPDRFPLPVGIPTRVVVRYSRDSQSARAHATIVSQVLQAQGVKIVDLVNDPKLIDANSLTFFYKDDRGSAARLTKALPEFQFKIYRSTPNDTIPRPGIIEIAVAA